MNQRSRGDRTMEAVTVGLFMIAFVLLIALVTGSFAIGLLALVVINVIDRMG